MALTKEEMRRTYGATDPKKMGFLSKIKMLFLHPKQFFEGVKGEGLKPAFLMFLAILLITSIGNAIVQSVFLPTDLSSLALLPFSLLLALAMTVLLFLWTHLFVRLLGGKGGWRQTVKALLYAYVPPMIVFFIVGVVAAPMLGGVLTVGPQVLLNPTALFSIGILLIFIIIIGLWALYLDGLGLGRMHSFSTLRGAGAVVLSIIMAIVLIIVLAVFGVYR